MFSTACISYGVSWGLEEVNMYTRKGPNAVHLAPRSELYTTTMTTYYNLHMIMAVNQGE